jgi:hypothetical protein
MGTGAIEALRASMHGAVIGPDDPDNGEARKVWNADIDRRPALIARCTYGPAKYERLAQIKRQYDPDNVFHRNANIKPAEAGVR